MALGTAKVKSKEKCQYANCKRRLQLSAQGASRLKVKDYQRGFKFWDAKFIKDFIDEVNDNS